MGIELFKKPTSNCSFEVDLVIRDVNGNPIGRRSYASDNAGDIERFFLRMQGKPKKKKHKSEGAASTDKDTVKALTEVENYIKQEYDSKKEQE